MAYSKDTNLSPAMQAERDLLMRGLSYAEVAASTGAKINTIKERNRLIYRISLRDSYRARIEREGIKCRYDSGDSFGWWFSGYFDGEGCLTVFDRPRDNGAERRVGVQISCRDDDADVLAHIHGALGIGAIWASPARGATRPACNWRVERAADLAEIIIPLFDRYPLRSKKRLEYAIWRGLVVNQYVNTLGGTATRVGATVEEHAAFQTAREKIRDIRRTGRK